MRRILKYVICVAIFAMLILSVLYINTEHEYDLIKVEEIKTEDEYKNLKYEKEEDITKEESLIGTLVINKIDLKATIKEGSTSEVLKNYIGHIEETAKYDGNVGLAAHNRLNERRLYIKRRKRK